MAAMTKTRHPGIYRRGARYVVAFRDTGGKQRWESAKTLEEARKLKAAREADVARGEFHPAGGETFESYAREWVERYQGRGRRGFREGTREDYRRDLKRAYRFFGKRRKLTEITPRDVANFAAWLCDSEKVGAKLSDATVRRVLCPLRACFRSAVAEGLVRSNPTRDVALPFRPTEAIEEEQARAMTRAQLAAFMRCVPTRHRTLFEVLAATGLRISEALALQWQHVALNGSAPHVKVRRAVVKGRIGPPKSRHGRRNVPLGPELVRALRRHRMASEWPGDTDLVFPALNGEPHFQENLRRRVLEPTREEAGVPWAGFHSFRHSCASMLFERGANAVQVQRWLGHHSPSFTLATYCHLLDAGLGQPLDLAAELAAGESANKVQTGEAETGPNAEEALALETA